SWSPRRPIEMSNEWLPTSRRSRGRRRGGLAHPVGHAEGAARAMRPAGGADTLRVLQELGGGPIGLRVAAALAELPLERVVIVVGHGAERVTKTLQEQLVTEVAVEFVEQRVARGTGDAVSVALTSSAFDDLDAEDDILVLPGDHPLLSAETIAM